MKTSLKNGIIIFAFTLALILLIPLSQIPPAFSDDGDYDVADENPQKKIRVIEVNTDPDYPKGGGFLKFNSEFKFLDYLNNLKSDNPYSGLMPIFNKNTGETSSSLGWKCFGPQTMYSDGTKYPGKSWCHNQKNIIFLGNPSISLLESLKNINLGTLQIVDVKQIAYVRNSNNDYKLFYDLDSAQKWINDNGGILIFKSNAIFIEDIDSKMRVFDKNKESSLINELQQKIKEYQKEQTNLANEQFWMDAVKKREIKSENLNHGGYFKSIKYRYSILETIPLEGKLNNITDEQIIEIKIEYDGKLIETKNTTTQLDGSFNLILDPAQYTNYGKYFVTVTSDNNMIKNSFILFSPQNLPQNLISDLSTLYMTIQHSDGINISTKKIINQKLFTDDFVGPTNFKDKQICALCNLPPKFNFIPPESDLLKEIKDMREKTSEFQIPEPPIRK